MDQEDIHKRLARAVDKMPAFPRSVQRILELTRDINCRPKDLVSAIEKDPVIAIKILRVVNSAFYNLPTKVSSINRAVVILGLNTVKNLALSFASLGTLPPHNPAGFDVQKYLMHSLTTASIARTLCSQVHDGVDPMDCYIAGLLHDFGKIVLAQFLPDEFKEALARSRELAAPLHQSENEVLGADHTLVGAMLVQKWQFPGEFVDCVRHHHDATASGTTMGSCLFLADEISKRILVPGNGEYLTPPIPQAIAERFGDSYEEIIARLGDLTSISDEARFYAQVGSEA